MREELRAAIAVAARSEARKLEADGRQLGMALFVKRLNLAMDPLVRLRSAPANISCGSAVQTEIAMKQRKMGRVATTANRLDPRPRHLWCAKDVRVRRYVRMRNGLPEVVRAHRRRRPRRWRGVVPMRQTHFVGFGFDLPEVVKP